MGMLGPHPGALLGLQRPPHGHRVHRAPDGRRALIRPIRPTDGHHLLAGFARVSAETLRNRFHASRSTFTPHELEYLTRVDSHDHIAWVAVALTEPGAPGIAVARCIRDAARRWQAEFAIIIVDDWHGARLGRSLFAAVARAARHRGIITLTADVLPGNGAARRMFERAGGRLAGGDGVTVRYLLDTAGR